MTQDELDVVAYSLHDGIAQIALNRPEVRNAITPELLAGLERAFERAVDEGASGAVLTGKGPGFCAGADLQRAATIIANDPDGAAMWEFNATGNRVILALRSLPFVTVAAVEGAVAGAGIGFALATDFRVFARSARLVPRFAALGVTPDNSSSYFLSHFLGAAPASKFFLRNEHMDADEAQRLGLADEVVEDGGAVVEATRLARQLSTVSSYSVAGIRELSFAAHAHSLSSHLALEGKWASGVWPVFREQAETELNEMTKKRH